MIEKKVLPFKLAITDETLTPLAGLVLFGEFLRGAGVDREIGRIFPAAGSAKGYTAWGHVQPLLLMLHGGGRALEDLRKVGSDRGLLKLLGVKGTPSPDATGDWLRRQGLRGVKALGRANRWLLKRALREDGRDGYTLDIDATGIEADKALAEWTYKHFKGYMPMTGHLAENGLVVAHEFREGNVSPNTRNLEFYLACRKAMPAGKRITAFRADSASYQGDLLDRLHDDHVSYAVGGRLDAATLAVIAAVPAKAWRPYRDGFVAETVHTMNTMKTAFRLIVFKRLRQGSLFGEEPFYHVVASNREETAEQTLDGYHQRGEHSENRIKELKLDFGMERMPCGQFQANALFFAVGVLAYNLFKLFARTVLPPSWRTKRAGSVRYAFYAVAGKVVRTGGQLLLRVNREAHAMFTRVRSAVARMESG
jgi:Transposase DDE domain group 1